MASSRARLASAVGLALGLSLAFPAGAQPPDPKAPTSEPPQTPEQKIAAQHFKRARELYLQGSYREALAELETAHKLDPQAKDLVFNLGVVNEKLLNIDEAIEWFKKYAQMDLSAAEREKADTILRRLDGAKKELEEKKRLAEIKRQQELDESRRKNQQPPTIITREAPPNGRIDALTIGAAGLAGVGLVVGTIFAVKASSDKPQSGFVTGRDGSYADLASRADSAHSSAVVADVGFAIGIVAGVGAALLYFLRPRDDAPPAHGKARVLAGPFGVTGSF